MKKHLYLMPVMALSMAAFALTACDDKKQETAADAPLESSMPVAEVPAEDVAADAQEEAISPIALSDVHAYATAPGASNGAIFAKIANNSASADFLISASTAIAANVEIHQTSQDPQTGAMLMRKTSGIDIPANGTVALTPDGYHVMLIDLVAPLTGGQSFEVTLNFRNGGEVIVPVTVVTVGAEELGQDHHGHDHAGHGDEPATASDATADATISEDAAESAPVAETPAEEAPIDGTIQQ